MSPIGTIAAGRRRSAFAFPDLSGLTPSYNVPTVSVSALGQSANTSIAGSAGFMREKRVGVAEAAASTTPASAQTSTALLDRTGSTHYRYPGAGWSSSPPFGWPGNPGQYVKTDYKAGGSAQAAYWPFPLDITTSSPTVAVRLNVTSTSGRIGIITVDGLRPQTALFVFPASPAAGSGGELKLVFPDSRSRRIRILGLNHNEGRFGGVAVESGYTVTVGGTQGRTIVVVGDSYVQGAVNTSTLETWAWICGFKLGGEVIVNGGIGSTGYDAIISGQPTSNFAGRTADVLAENPDLVIIAGGRNDMSGSNIQTTAETLIQSYLTGGLTTSQIALVPTCTDSHARRTELIAAAATKGVRFVNVSVDSYAKEGDGVHMTLAAHQTFGADVAAILAA